MYIDAFKRLLFERLNCLKRMCVCQRQGSSFAMSKAAVRKLHWRSKVQESFIPLVGSSGELGVAVGGGADYGEFPFVTATPGGGFTVGDIILEIGGTPVLGMTLGDVRGVLNSCLHPIRIKTVSPGSALCKDLRLYLSKCFTPGSMDSQLQQVIRENLYLRAVPCTTRLPHAGEISGVDYNFVSIEEFFSLEESGALLESGKFKGNYYGTPRPVHIGPESPPITYQEHRNLLRNFRTRSKSLSNLEKAAEEGENSEEDSGLSGRFTKDRLSRGLVGIGNAYPVSLSRGSIGGDGSAMENGHGSTSSRVRAVMPKNWEVAYSDSGEPFYIDHNSKMTSWQDPRAQSNRETTLDKNTWFTDEPGELRGFSIHTRFSKGPRGFGFNIVGGSRAREFLQVYSVTPGGPGALNTADILVYINGVCVLGTSHKEVVEMLKAVPVGHSVDMVLRRGYPMLYNPDGCPKQPHPGFTDICDPFLPPTTTQPQPSHQRLPLLRPSTAPTQTQYHNLNGVLSHHHDVGYMGPGVRPGLDANGNATSTTTQSPSSYRHSSGHLSHSADPPSYRRSSRYLSDSTSPTPPSYRQSSGSITPTTPPVRPPRSLRGLARLQASDNCQSDSEVVSAIGSHRAFMIRNHNNNSLYTPPQPLRYRTSKSDLPESALSTSSTLPVSRLPMPKSETPRLSSSPGGGAYSRLIRPQASLLRPPPTPDSPHLSFNGFHGYTSGSGSPISISSPGAMSLGSGFGVGGGVGGGGELVPVALAQCEGGGGMGFSVTAGGQGGRLALVKRVWDRRQCSSLQPGDAIMKINGADVQSLSFAQVQQVLQEHTKQGEVVLLVHRRGSHRSSISPNSMQRVPSPLLCPHPPPVASDNNPSPPVDVLILPRPSSTPPPPAMVRSSLVQSTSFLESVPVTLTMEPKDWLNEGMEDEGDREVVIPGPGQEGGGRNRVPRGVDVELRRKPGEGFGFVIASEDVENRKAASLLPHRFVTVRRGSPSARSGQIRPGDRLEAVDGRSVVTLPHRELAHILRRAGNTLRLTIIPRPSTYSSSLSETADYDPNYRSRKGHRSRPKHDSRYYSVDLDRGPTGFGFSLRGGNEYNMSLYVLGLMEGGPASRSHKIQVSDQLVEINGDSTAGMTHSLAVEQIRRGGHRIHLVLKKGNGYVPDYGRERRVTSPFLPLQHPKEQSVAAVDLARRASRSYRSKVKKRGRSSKGRENKKKGSRSGRGRGSSSEGEEGAGEVRHSPDSDPGPERQEEEDSETGGSGLRERTQVRERDRRRKNRNKGGSHSLPRDALRKHNNDNIHIEAERGNERGRERERRRDRKRKSRSEERVRKRENRKTEEEEEVKEREEKKDVEEEEVEEEEEDEEEDAYLPITNKRLPRPKQDWEEEDVEERERKRREWDMERERELESERLREIKWERKRINDEERERSQSLNNLLSLESRMASPLQRDPFSFLTPSSELEHAESVTSHSDGSVYAASVSGLSLALTEGSVLGTPALLLPGPWLKPSQQRITEVIQENRLAGEQRKGGRGRGRGVMEESGI
ncbi:membrane-associated guanylate kinase, WW and PDZ domain-containing protein 3 isoform 3-T3 [Salvelinus alpinus]